MPRLMNDIAQIPVHCSVDRETFESQIVRAAAPVVLKGLVDDWPLVRATRESPAALARVITTLDAGLEPYVIEAPASADGRIFYRDDFTGFNFTRRPAGWARRSIACCNSPERRVRRPCFSSRCPRKTIYRALPARTVCHCWMHASSRASGSAMRSRSIPTSTSPTTSPA